MNTDERIAALFQRIDTQIETLAPGVVNTLRSTKREVYIYLSDLSRVFFYDTYRLNGSPNTRQIKRVEYHTLLFLASKQEWEHVNWQEMDQRLPNKELEEAFVEAMKHETRSLDVTTVFQN